MSSATHLVIGTLSVLACIAGCAGDPSIPDGLAVEQHDDALIRGSFRAGDTTILFDAEAPRPFVGVATVTIGEVQLVLSADATQGEIRFDAGAAMLTTDQRGALVTFSQAIGGYLGDVEDVDHMHASVLVDSARYFAEAPIQTELRSTVQYVQGLDRTIANATGDDGKKCISRGSTVTAWYDGDQGTTAENWVVGASGGTQWNGDFSCMGRCGAGCGSYDWTLDCLEHDACSRHYYSTTGALDHNCGDEYAEASDDYVAFWKRCY